MTCQELVELVSDYLDGALSDAEREELEAHLETCPGCVIYLEQMRVVIWTMGRVWSYDRT